MVSVAPFLHAHGITVTVWKHRTKLCITLWKSRSVDYAVKKSFAAKIQDTYVL